MKLPLRPTIALSVLLFAVGCGSRSQPAKPLMPDGEWREFVGTWIAQGTRQILALGEARRASIARLEGSLVLSGPSRPVVGFRADAMVLNDTATGLLGRAVWTDEHGDQVFSELQGEGTATDNKITGTFIGGTGRYAGVTGAYEFSWRFLLENEDGTTQGQSMGLKGRVRIEPAKAMPERGGQQR